MQLGHVSYVLGVHVIYMSLDLSVRDQGFYSVFVFSVSGTISVQIKFHYSYIYCSLPFTID